MREYLFEEWCSSPQESSVALMHVDAQQLTKTVYAGFQCFSPKIKINNNKYKIFGCSVTVSPLIYGHASSCHPVSLPADFSLCLSEKKHVAQ